MVRTSAYLASFASILGLAFALPLPSAQPLANNPTDVMLRADFPQGNAQTVVGVIQFYSLNGTTKVHVDVTGLPKNSGMFSYHIHEKPVGADKSCAGTGAHFNPFAASSDCEALGNDALCEIGDLSGKHGLINTTCFELFYYDPYLSLDPSSPQYIGNKAINIHLDNGDRLACATIKPSREPEDLLLLNAETEAEEVRKFEELAGIAHQVPQAPLQATSVASDEQTFVETSTTTADGAVSESNDGTGLDLEDEADTTGPVYPSVDADVDVDNSESYSDMDLDTLVSDDTENRFSLGEYAGSVLGNNEDDDGNTKNSTTFANSTNSTNGSLSGSGDEAEENRATSMNSGIALSVMVAVALGFLW